MDKAAFLDLVVEIVHRSDKAVNFEVIPRRWVVERTFSWMIRWRRLRRGRRPHLRSRGNLVAQIGAGTGAVQQDHRTRWAMACGTGLLGSPS
jgi:transposase